ncbi:MAG: hypothetical protein OJF50_001074 [Nitrospira sp.]|nr:hypothetical protein [Nitrospira sp.]
MTNLTAPNVRIIQGAGEIGSYLQRDDEAAVSRRDRRRRT